jgi:hypothetical protein
MFAAAALRPGGLLVAYSGQYWLPQVIASLSEHLTYVWAGSLVMPGPSVEIRPHRIHSNSKPVLIYTKDGYKPHSWLHDTYIKEDVTSRVHHKWEQGVEPVKHYLDALSKKGDMVCDPFVGSGTTAVACVLLGLSFTGCDIDANAVRTARRRVAAGTKEAK